MNEWKCTIKTPSNWLQTVYVEAYTHSDAVTFAESQTGGKCIMAVPDNSYSSSSSSNDNNSEASFSPGFVFFLLAAVFFVYAWKWILLIAIAILFIWFIAKYTES